MVAAEEWAAAFRGRGHLPASVHGWVADIMAIESSPCHIYRRVHAALVLQVPRERRRMSIIILYISGFRLQLNAR